MMAGVNQRTQRNLKQFVGLYDILVFCILYYDDFQVSDGSICRMVAWIAFFVRDWWIGWRDQILLEIVGKWNCDGLIKLLHNTTPPHPSSGRKFRILAWRRFIHRKRQQEWCQRLIRITAPFSLDRKQRDQTNSISEIGKLEIFEDFSSVYYCW